MAPPPRKGLAAHGRSISAREPANYAEASFRRHPSVVLNDSDVDAVMGQKGMKRAADDEHIGTTAAPPPVANFQSWLADQVQFSQSLSVPSTAAKKQNFLDKFAPLKALSRFAAKKAVCNFSMHVHGINALPTGLNGRELVVQWQRRGMSVGTSPSIIRHGIAKFEQTLQLNCTLFFSIGTGGSIKYQPKASSLCVRLLGVPSSDVGHHLIDLAKLAPNSLNAKDQRTQTLSFKLGGKAEGSTLVMTFGYEMQVSNGETVYARVDNKAYRVTSDSDSEKANVDVSPSPGSKKTDSFSPTAVHAPPRGFGTTGNDLGVGVLENVEHKLDSWALLMELKEAKQPAMQPVVEEDREEEREENNEEDVEEEDMEEEAGSRGEREEEIYHEVIELDSIVENDDDSVEEEVKEVVEAGTDTWREEKDVDMKASILQLDEKKTGIHERLKMVMAEFELNVNEEKMKLDGLQSGHTEDYDAAPHAPKTMAGESTEVSSMILPGTVTDVEVEETVETVSVEGVKAIDPEMEAVSDEFLDLLLHGALENTTAASAHEWGTGAVVYVEEGTSAAEAENLESDVYDDEEMEEDVGIAPEEFAEASGENSASDELVREADFEEEENAVEVEEQEQGVEDGNEDEEDMLESMMKEAEVEHKKAKIKEASRRKAQMLDSEEEAALMKQFGIGSASKGSVGKPQSRAGTAGRFFNKSNHAVNARLKTVDKMKGPQIKEVETRGGEPDSKNMEESTVNRKERVSVKERVSELETIKAAVAKNMVLNPMGALGLPSSYGSAGGEISVMDSSTNLSLISDSSQGMMVPAAPEMTTPAVSSVPVGQGMLPPAQGMSTSQGMMVPNLTSGDVMMPDKGMSGSQGLMLAAMDPMKIAMPDSIAAPDLLQGVGSAIPTAQGGMLVSMSGKQFSSSGSRLVMQFSRAMVVPKEMGEDAGAIIKSMGCLSMETLSDRAHALMPMTDISGKPLEQIAGEGIAFLEGSHTVSLPGITAPQRRAIPGRGQLAIEGGPGSGGGELVTYGRTADGQIVMGGGGRGGAGGLARLNQRRRCGDMDGDAGFPVEFVGLDELAPLAIDQLEGMVMEGLKVQGDVAEEEAPYAIESGGSGWDGFAGGALALEGGKRLGQKKVGAQSGGSYWKMLTGGGGGGGGGGIDDAADVEDLMGMAISLDEWQRLDAGIFDDFETEDDTLAVLEAHMAAHGDIDSLEKVLKEGGGGKELGFVARGGGGAMVRGGRKMHDDGGLMGDSVTVAMIVQLRDPMRNFEPVGVPMMALLQAERASAPPEARKAIGYGKADSKSTSATLNEIDGNAGVSTDEVEVEKPTFKLTGVHVMGLKSEKDKDAGWGSKQQEQAGSRWLAAHGMSKKGGKNAPKGGLKMKKGSGTKESGEKITVKPGDTLWSITQQVYGSGTKWTDVVRLNPHIRNPDIILPNQTVRMR